MPLRNHFRPPVLARVPWESLHSGWIGRLAEQLSTVLPPGYVALDRMRIDGNLEIDIGAAEDDSGRSPASAEPTGVGAAVAARPGLYTAPAPVGSCRYRGEDIAEIRIFTDEEDRKVVAALELVSPANKDRPGSREAFVAKCLDYLGSGVALVIVDVVTNRHANLHNRLAQTLGAPPEVELGDGDHLYATAYRPTGRGGEARIEFWANPLQLGEALPTMPLRLAGEVFVPVELEATYTATCVGRKLV